MLDHIVRSSVNDVTGRLHLPIISIGLQVRVTHPGVAFIITGTTVQWVKGPYGAKKSAGAYLHGTCRVKPSGRIVPLLPLMPVILYLR